MAAQVEIEGDHILQEVVAISELNACEYGFTPQDIESLSKSESDWIFVAFLTRCGRYAVISVPRKEIIYFAQYLSQWMTIKIVDNLVLASFSKTDA